MKRITLTISPVLLAGDDTDPLELEDQLSAAVLHLNGTLEAVTIEAIKHTGRAETETARPGTCGIGGHTFYAPHYWATDRPLPDICPQHARSEDEAQELEFHRPLFDEVTRLTGLTPLIYDSGGHTMTIIIPLNTPAPGHNWAPPYYLGLVEGHTDDGLWQGSVGFYADAQEADGGEGTDVVNASPRHPLHPHRWAALIAEHYHAHTRQNRPHS